MIHYNIIVAALPRDFSGFCDYDSVLSITRARSNGDRGSVLVEVPNEQREHFEDLMESSEIVSSYTEA